MRVPLTESEEAQLRALARRRGVPAEDLVLSAVRKLLPKQSAEDKVAALRTMLDGTPEEQQETGDYLVRVLDEDRLSHRRLYS